MNDLNPYELAELNAGRKKQKFPAGRGLFAIGFTIALATCAWLNLLPLVAIILICFLYGIYVLTETSEELFDQVSMLRFEHATLRQQFAALGEEVRELRMRTNDSINEE